MVDTVTTTATSGPTLYVQCDMAYYANKELIQAFQKILRTARRWKKECPCKGKRHCEYYGCASLDELLSPIAGFRRKKTSSVKKARTANVR